MQGEHQPFRARVLAAWFLGVFVLVAITYRSVPGLAMLGWDSWPLVAAGKIDSLGAFFGTFSEELMEGRYPHGRFYRPVTHLAFGFDHWISGLDPAGYHRTDLFLFGLCALALGAAAWQLTRSHLAAGIASALFILHPVQLEVLVVPARRADTLALLFGLLALVSLRRVDRCRWPLGLALAALAAGSKETGVWIALAAPLWVVFVLGEKRLVPRVAPIWCGVALYLVARTLVLGGLGGHASVDGAGQSDADWSGLFAGALDPEPGLFGASALPLAIGGLIACALALASSRRREWLFLPGLALACLLPLALADRIHAWYGVLLTPALCLAAGAAAGVAVRGGGNHRWFSAGFGLGGPLLLGVVWGQGSGALGEYPRLEGASQWLSESYGALEEATEGRVEGDSAHLADWPIGVIPAKKRRDVQSLALSQTYSVAAFLELLEPDREVQVRWGPPPVSPSPGVLVVSLMPGSRP